MALHYVAVMADSAALTAGLVAATPPAKRGATLAVYSFFGFGAGFLGPLAFGWVFDLTGGEGRLAWGLAFASLGAASIRDMGRVMRPQQDFGVMGGGEIGQRRAPGAGAEHRQNFCRLAHHGSFRLSRRAQIFSYKREKLAAATTLSTMKISLS